MGKNLPINSRCLNETDETDYSFLEIEQNYVVYGLMFYFSRIDYLICPESENPVWIPANFFEIIDNKLDDDWSICITNINNDYQILYDNFRIQSIIGYSNLVNSISHYVGILEREETELKNFFIEKIRIDAKY